MARTISIALETPEVFRPLLQPARYKGAYGGRGSGKSHFFAEALVEHCALNSGVRALCIREVQRSLATSSKLLIEDKIKALGLGAIFGIRTDRIITPGGGLISFVGMNDQTAETVKSFENYLIAWLEEAQTISERSFELLRPTIRAPGSEIWASWNPTRKSDAIDQFFRQSRPANAIVVKANWRDNPFFPPELEEERRLDLATFPDRYPHIWEGDYATAVKGAYFARELSIAKTEGRFGRVAIDPAAELRAYFDLGYSDATAIWIVQFIGQAITVADYIEASGQPPSFYMEELRRRGYARALCVLPHDADQISPNNASAMSYRDQFAAGGFRVEHVKNQGAGAAMRRVNAVRRIFPRVWFDEQKTAPGVEALAVYHEKFDAKRGIGLGPEHDWSSHAADAFGLMAIHWREPFLVSAEEDDTWSKRRGNAVTGY